MLYLLILCRVTRRAAGKRRGCGFDAENQADCFGLAGGLGKEAPSAWLASGYQAVRLSGSRAAVPDGLMPDGLMPDGLMPDGLIA